MTDPVLLGEDPWGHNHDERLWGDPYAFRPERFLGEAARRPGSVSWLLRANAGDRVPGAWTLVFGFAGVAITGVTGRLGPSSLSHRRTRPGRAASGTSRADRDTGTNTADAKAVVVSADTVSSDSLLLACPS